ncbi:MAG: HEAT repeat domain-containing protein [Nitrospiraceae bacterium]
MKYCGQPGQANLTAILALLCLIVTGVWVWKRIPPDTQDAFVDRAIPLVLLSGLVALMIWLAVRAIRERRRLYARRDHLIAAFERQTSSDKKLELAFTLIEVNRYRRDGLERIAHALQELFATTLTQLLGDKQHRVRGMAASHLGVLREKASIPLLLAALDDDHAYVRAGAALGLGRMRAIEAKEKLSKVMEEDWDQTVRSRAKEALERIG